MQERGDITLLLDRVAQGDSEATGTLLHRVYQELRQLAAAKMRREPTGQTLQATALVHEAWLRLGGDRQPRWSSRAHFFAAAAEAMRRILIDAARRKRAARHGGGQVRLVLHQTGFDVAAPTESDELLAVDEALERLRAVDARKAQLVTLRYFGGLSLEETAAALDLSVPTASRDWAYARAWLFREIQRSRAANRRGAGPRVPAESDAFPPASRRATSGGP